MENKVEEYILEFEDSKKKVLEDYRKTILESSDLLKEKISWGMPSYYINKYIIHFAGHKNHVGVYVGENTVNHFSKELENYNHKKGTIQVKYTDEIPKALIKKLIDYNIIKDIEKGASK